MASARRYWEAVGEQWQRAPRQRLWRRHHDRISRALIERWLGEERPRRVLKTDLFEEAVGGGVTGQVVASDGVYGIDIASSTARAARGHTGLQVVCSDVRQLPFAAGAFDVVISTSTLDHLETTDALQGAFGELARALRPGGDLVLTLDNLDNPIVRLRNALPRAWAEGVGLVPYMVGVTCGWRGLRRCLRRAGLEVIEIATVMHCPRVAAGALAELVERRLPEASHAALLGGLAAWELLGRLPTRRWTGHFVAAHARRPPSAGSGR